MKKRIITVVIVVLALAVAGVGGFILYKNISNQNTEENYKKISESYVAEITGAQDSTVKKEPSCESGGFRFTPRAQSRYLRLDKGRWYRG